MIQDHILENFNIINNIGLYHISLTQFLKILEWSSHGLMVQFSLFEFKGRHPQNAFFVVVYVHSLHGIKIISFNMIL